VILHLDLDAFFASVEQLKDPRLRGKPVAVGNGVVASPSYEARARGVTTAMPLHQARRVCPELIVLDGRHEVYRCFTDSVWEILRREAPALETFLDEAFADFTGTEGAVGDFGELGRRLRREIREDVGLPATIGIARNRMLAKLAAKSVKPDGLRVLREEERRARELLESLTDEQRLIAAPADAKPGEVVFGPGKQFSEAPRGIPAAELTSEQRALLEALLLEYIGNFRAELAERELARCRARGFDAIHFLWLGSTKPGQPLYYRLHGPHFLVEFDVVGDNHVHALWRDLENDFGADLLRRHREAEGR